MKSICTINLNEGEGRQTIYLGDDHKLYTDGLGNGELITVDDYEYESVEAAVEACDVYWGRSDILNVWGLEWIED